MSPPDGTNPDETNYTIVPKRTQI